MSYSEVIQILANNLLVHFSEVYHSVEIITNDSGERFPAISLNDEWISLVPEDQRETLYIRRNGDDEATELKIGSCAKSYSMKTPLRVVFFKDHAEKHNEILSKLMQSVLVGHTKLVRIITDKWRLQKDESSGDYSFGAKTAYFALDIYGLWQLTPSTCEEDFCVGIANPLKKECVIESGEEGGIHTSEFNNVFN